MNWISYRLEQIDYFILNLDDIQRLEMEIIVCKRFGRFNIDLLGYLLLTSRCVVLHR